jgi:hypothetical protein
MTGNWIHPGKWTEQKGLVGIALFILSLLLLYWLAGDVLQLAGDEAIYLQGGRLVALGQQPYRDFFAITGPLTFWIEGSLASASGMSLAIMRLPPIFDVAFLAWAVYWLTSRYAGTLYSAGAAIVFLACEVRIRQLNVNHRWDSAALAMAAIVLAFEAQRGGRGVFCAASGLLVVASACATPSMLLVALPLLAWCGRGSIRNALLFVGGATLAAGVAAFYLQHVHALVPMIQSMRWTAANYTQANRVFYGGLGLAVPGPATAGWTSIPGFLFSFLPAFLPPAALVAWLFCFRRPIHRTDLPQVLPLLVVSAALVFAAWPRWTSDVLLHTLAPSWFLCALLLYRVTDAPQRRWLLIALLAALASLGGKAVVAMDYDTRETRVGTLRAPLDQSEFLEALEHWIQPGDSLFSFPYLPSAYYFLNARNPTRYSFLQPGMMTAEDERLAIDELAAAPPRWVLFEHIPPQAILAFWPGSDPSRIPMTAMKSYLGAHYHRVDTLAGPLGHFEVVERNPTDAIP